MIELICFYSFSALLLFTSLLTVVARKPITSVFYLMASFFNASVLMIMMGAEFVAFLTVIVYIGAISVLLLFVIMMLGISFNKEKDKTNIKTKVMSALIALTMAAEFLFVYYRVPLLEIEKDENIETVGNLYSIGEFLYTEYAYPLQIVGFILLMAMIGSITLVFKGKEDVKKAKGE